jgi:hypothetical protein
MDPMSAGFLGFMLLGALWVMWRIGKYVRFHRGHEHAWSQLDSKEDFQQFVASLKNNKQAGKPLTANGEPQSPASPPVETPEPPDQKQE